MGYYDQDYEQNSRKQKGNRGGKFLPGLLGAILGGLLVIFSIPVLANMDILPYDLALGDDDEETGEDQTPNETEPSKNISVDVSTAVTQAVDKVSKAVVGVVNIQEAGFWNEKGEAGTGSGVIYKKEGGNAFVVTNYHVIAGATQIELSLSDGTRVPAEVLGSDELMDLAVLRTESKQVEQVAEFANSDDVKPGEPVIAIGNPLGLQFSGSVTQGIISGTERAIPVDSNNDGEVDWNAEVLQTDAAINPGNSGGALVNIDGKLIGINSMKIAQSAVEGIGLAIPINLAAPIIDDLEKYGEVRRPFLGIGMRSLNEVSSYHWEQTLKLPENVKSGVVVMSVNPASPAGQAGLKEMDVITEFDGKELKDIIDLRKQLYKKAVGENAELVFYREGKKQSVKLKLGEEQEG
ncbi:S1C family serine protease [Metabacillus idriensis]|uniref:PDZ domain-containing protein n=1 Tax=Metabacillus idriensis TaxID=324768 RepID=A0A6I2M9G5_9BACI|nr:S1C family serine protease [Metabacillus idriensis]MCM3597271.1 S1C family serine protease [Metabacillus idriensis]MRX54024.1 PDZ domain-containing protein [Metabacillus idriensis]OHR73191.1 serine protease [Bacillus sp. HMSC76G11]